MIIYNVGRQWFSDKGRADKYRVTLGLKPASLVTVRVNGRDDMSALLNALCEASSFATAVFQPAGNAGKVVIPAVYEDVEVPDFIPAFLLKDGKRRV